MTVHREYSTGPSLPELQSIIHRSHELRSREASRLFRSLGRSVSTGLSRLARQTSGPGPDRRGSSALF